MKDDDFNNGRYYKDADWGYLGGILKNLSRQATKGQKKLDKEALKPKNVCFKVCTNWKRFGRGVHRAYTTIIAHIKKWIENA